MMQIFKPILMTAALALASTLAFAGPVDINHANAEALAANIKGVGPKLAASIVAYREANGPFTTVEDLEKVKGVGPSTVENNRDALSVSASSGTQ